MGAVSTDRGSGAATRGVELVVAGCQGGDEGKGRFTDVYAGEAWAVVRYQGGPNTGHSVTVGERRYRFVQVPSGYARGRMSVIGNGCVIDPIALLVELEELNARGFQAPLAISETAHVVFPYHRLQDQAMERLRGAEIAVSAATGLGTGEGRIGSTCTGVGPCREDKIARIGLRLLDLLEPELLRSRLRWLLSYKRAVLQPSLGLEAEAILAGEDWDLEALAERYAQAGERLAPFLCDVGRLLANGRREGRHILYEGAQSFGLDVEQGTYPFCSSGHSAANGVHVGTGTPPSVAFQVFGVVKSYMSQVGGGPLLTEISGPEADHIVERGQEFGVVTGRRRRVGWLDLPFVRRSVRGDGCTHLCVSCLDALAGLDTVKVATHYDIRGDRVDEIPRRLRDIADANPVYVSLPGWPDVDWEHVAREGLSAVPANARSFLDFISSAIEIPIAAVGVGPSREHTIILWSPFKS